MQTVGKRHRRRTPGGDYLSQCFECRAPTLRSDLERRADGNLYHRKGDCGPSKLGIELDRGNAEKSRLRKRYPTPEGAISLDGVEFDTLGQPTNPMVGWLWVKGDGRVYDKSRNLTTKKLSAGIIQIEGASFDFSQAGQFEPFNVAVFQAAAKPMFYTLGKAGPSTAVLKIRSRINTVDFVEDQACLVLLYGAGWVSGMLTQVAEIWVKGSDGTLLDSEGATVTTARTGTGLYTYAISGTTYRFATPSQQCQGDPTLVTPALLQVGMVDGSHATGRSVNLSGVALDADHCVRFFA